MLTITPLETITPVLLRELITGYKSEGKYEVIYAETAVETSFILRYQPLPAAITRRYEHLDDPHTVQLYQKAAGQGFSFLARLAGKPAGLLIADVQAWNHSVWVWEFHVAEPYRRQGIGRQLMQSLEKKARQADLRTIVCETQNVNAAAIDAYRRLGFHLQGVDIAYYTNEDYPHGDIAVFMKKPLPRVKG